jgi:hypothetical protein
MEEADLDLTPRVLEDLLADEMVRRGLRVPRKGE